MAASVTRHTPAEWRAAFDRVAAGIIAMFECEVMRAAHGYANDNLM